MQSLLSRQINLVKKYGIRSRFRALLRRLLGIVAITILECSNSNQIREYYSLLLGIHRKDSLTLRIWRLTCYYATDFLSLDNPAKFDYSSWLKLFDVPETELIEMLGQEKYQNTKMLVILYFEHHSSRYLQATLESLFASVGQSWHAVVIFEDDCAKRLLQEELDSLVLHDQRFLTESCHSMHFDMTVLIKGGLIIKPHALRIISDVLMEKPETVLTYSDEDLILAEGTRSKPWFKPEFSPLLIEQGWLLGGLIGVKKELAPSSYLLDRLSNDRPAFQAFVVEIAAPLSRDKVVRIPHVLYGDYVPAQTPLPIKYSEVATLPKISLIIPTRDRWDLLGPCLTSLLMTDWPLELMEIVVVDNGTTDTETLDMLAREEANGRLICVKSPETFNWSRLNNVGAAISSGEVLVFLNNDTEVLDPQWLRKMVPLTMMTRVGAVGCKLLYPDGTVQHGGVIAGIRGRPVHAHIGLESMSNGYYQLATMTHEVSAVTGACLLVTRQKFYSLGGFNEDLRVAFNDIDFCFRFLKSGLYNVYVGNTSLTHKECKSRGYDTTPEKLQLQHEEAAKTWLLHSSIMRNDPFYSPNLSAWKPYELSFLPRRMPWWNKYSHRSRKVMIVARCHIVHEQVAEAIKNQVDCLQDAGYQVIIAGPKTPADQIYMNCERYIAYDDVRAAKLAAELGVDLVIAHSQPFYAISRWTGLYPAVMACIYDSHGAQSQRNKGVVNNCDVAEEYLYFAMATAIFFVKAGYGKSSKLQTKSRSSNAQGAWTNAFMETVESLMQ